MEIAKKISSEDYNKLNLNDYTDSDWQTAFDYLDKRLTERFVEPIEVLQNAEKDKSAIDKKFGFAILAIDCLLIETIQSFYEGKTDTKGKSGEIFGRFLTQRENFKSYFSSEQNSTKLKPTEFYTNFRCGILHQSQTFGDTKIWTVGELISQQGKYVVVNRNAFHDAVLKEKNIYLDLLKRQDNHDLLKNFKDKMDFIAS
jgi:hypothetical protein